MLSSITADWRYSISDSTQYANGPTTHPVLYVAAGSADKGVGSGVFQSVDGGLNWTYFPDTTYGAVVEGGYMPAVAVTSLSLALGNIDPDTGMPTLDGPDAPSASNRTSPANADPDTLMASTFGQGSFAINVAPLIIGNAVTLNPTYPATTAITGPIVGGPITINGTSEISGFGNATWITVEDVTDPANPRIIAGFNPNNPVPTPNAANSTNAFGNFSIPLNPFTAFSTTGVKTIEVFATDDAGSVGNKVIYTFNFDPATQLVFDPNGEPPATALLGSNFATPTPVLVDALDAAGNIDPAFNGPVTISLANNAMGTLATGTSLTETAVNGVATFTDLEIDTDGTYQLAAANAGNPAAMVPGLTTGTSTSIYIVGAAASLYVVTEPPLSVEAGASFDVQIGADDASGNPTPYFTGTVSLGVLNIPNDPSLGGTLTENVNSAGIADFPGVMLFQVAGSPYKLQATSTGLTSTTTRGITVTPAPATQFVILPSGEPPSSVVAGQVFPMTVDAEDPYGNLDTNFGGSVTIALPSIIMGTPTVTAMHGVANFNNLWLQTVGTYELQAGISGGSPTPATSTSVTVTPNPTPDIIAWVDEPPMSVDHDTGFGAAVQVEDQYGNVETGYNDNVNIALDVNPTGATLGGTLSVPASDGVAVFDGLTINKVSPANSFYTLQASIASVTSPDSSDIVVTPIPAVGLEIATQPMSPVQVFQTFGLSVTIFDQAGDPDPDFNSSVTVSIASGCRPGALWEVA